MNRGFLIAFWGPYACFTRPEFKAERYSYECPTPSAIRGMLEAIYWHPYLRWIVDKIYILNPIEYTSFCRNEVTSKISAKKVKDTMQGKNISLYINTHKDITQRVSTVLKNVYYVVEAHFEINHPYSEKINPDKVTAIVSRRLDKGQCFHQPYFGCREFPAMFKRWGNEEILTQPISKDLGFMLYDINYATYAPMFFKAEVVNGVVDLKSCKIYQ